MVYGIYFTVYGSWFMVHGSWFEVHGLGRIRSQFRVSGLRVQGSICKGYNHAGAHHAGGVEDRLLLAERRVGQVVVDRVPWFQGEAV